MAQTIKLKRSSVPGKIPTAGQMEIGELALNSADGKIFVRDNSEVRPIVTTGAEITGSINLTGAVTASFFKGDGSEIYNLPLNDVDVGQVATIAAEFTNTSSINIEHGFDTRNVIVSAYSSSYEQIIPKMVLLHTLNEVKVEFSENTSGYVVVAKGGHLVSGTIENANTLNNQPGSYYLDYNNFTQVPSLISSSNQITLLDAGTF